VDAGKLEAIRAVLGEVGSGGDVELRFRGVGFFPNEKRPRVLWAGIAASPNLAPLAAEIDARLEKLGIARETREYAPHLTLARFDPPGISEKLRAAAQENAAREFGAVRAGEFHLFESKTRSTGAEYTRLSSFPFTQAEA
jgi:2'-5' RNA ligase